MSGVLGGLIGSFALAASASRIVVGGLGSPYLNAWTWSSAGFGTKFSNPASLPEGDVLGVTFSTEGGAVIYSNQVTPYHGAYSWDDSTGFGTKRSASTAFAARAFQISYNNAGTIISFPIEVSTASTRRAIAWTDAGGFGTVYTSSNAVNLSVQMEWRTGDNAIVSAANTTTLAISAWTNASGFGSTYSNPSGAIGSGRGVDFSASGNTVFAGATNTPFIKAWPFTVASGAGTPYANPSPLPGAPETTSRVRSTNNGTRLIVGGDSTPFIEAYQFTEGSGWGTKLSDPSSLPQGSSRLRLSSDEKLLGVPMEASPWIAVYNWSSDGFGSRYSSPGTIPTSNGRQVSFK